MAMDREQVGVRLCELAAAAAGLDANQVYLHSRITEDFGWDSVGVVEFVMAVEDEFGPHLPLDPDVPLNSLDDIRTIGDVLDLIVPPQP